MPSRLIPVLVIGVVAISTASIFIRLAQQEAPSLVIAAWRLSLSSLFLFPLAWRDRSKFPFQNKKGIGLLVLSGTFLAAHFGLWMSSLQFTSITSSTILVTTTPLWTALLSPLLLKEKVGTRTLIGLAVSICGGILAAAGGACGFGEGGIRCDFANNQVYPQAMLGNFLALAGAWMASGYMMAGRHMRMEMPASLYSWSVYSVAALVLLSVTGLVGLPLFGYSGTTVLWLVLVAIIPQVIGHTAFNLALGYLPAVLVTLAVLAEPIGTSILGVIVLGEYPSIAEVSGGLIILIGILIAVWQPLNGQKKRAEAL